MTRRYAALMFALCLGTAAGRAWADDDDDDRGDNQKLMCKEHCTDACVQEMGCTTLKCVMKCAQSCRKETCSADPTIPQDNYKQITSTLVPGTSELNDCPVEEPQTDPSPTAPCARLSGTVKKKNYCGIIVTTPNGTVQENGNLTVLITRTNVGVPPLTFKLVHLNVLPDCTFTGLVSTRYKNANDPPIEGPPTNFWFAEIVLTPPGGRLDPAQNTCTSANICPGP
ncbi:MAG: hypothetical protein E6J42_05595 [Chloroflexi bacterium]|nr:MAG: hypothetical protein E6J42_05595 [Chloroflexota bacterium]